MKLWFHPCFLVQSDTLNDAKGHAQSCHNHRADVSPDRTTQIAIITGYKVTLAHRLSHYPHPIQLSPLQFFHQSPLQSNVLCHQLTLWHWSTTSSFYFAKLPLAIWEQSLPHSAIYSQCHSFTCTRDCTAQFYHQHLTVITLMYLPACLTVITFMCQPACIHQAF